MTEKREYMTYAKYALLATLGAFLVVGCSSQDKKAAGGMHAMPPLPVSTYKVISSDIPVSLEYPAKVKSAQQVNVVARVSGILEKKYFTEGSFVKSGETLYQIDSDRYEALMQEVQADVDVKEATLKQATRDWERTKVLFEQDAVSQKERDALELFSFIFGICFGSFLNVLILRLPLNESLMTARSHCPKCNHLIYWYHNIPLFSYLFLRAKCSFCKEKISLQYPLVEVFSVILAIIIYIKEDNTLNLNSIYIYFTFITLLALSIIDIKTKIIPIFLSLIGLCFAIFSNENYIVSFIYAASMIGIFYLIRSFFEVVLKKEILGEGDLIIFGIVGAILVEPTNIFSFLFLLGILSIIPSLYLIYKNKNKNILIDNRFDDLIKIVEKKSKQNENDFVYTKKINLLKEGLESFRIKDNLNSLPFVPFISLSLFIVYVGLKNI